MLKSNTMKKGFTLAELMVCLALISVIATILMPAIERLKPNKKKVMFKKAYYLTERIVSELVNDEDLYPFIEGKVGFDNTVEVDVNGVTYGGNVESSDAAKSKFCMLFASKLNTTSSVALANCKNNNLTDGTFTPAFSTTDAVQWILPVEGFPDKNTFYKIIVDVNGPDTPNCLDGACDDPDRFELQIRADGKMQVEGPKAKEYVGTVNIIENQKNKGN